MDGITDMESRRLETAMHQTWSHLPKERRRKLAKSVVNRFSCCTESVGKLFFPNCLDMRDRRTCMMRDCSAICGTINRGTGVKHQSRSRQGRYNALTLHFVILYQCCIVYVRWRKKYCIQGYKLRVNMHTEMLLRDVILNKGDVIMSIPATL